MNSEIEKAESTFEFSEEEVYQPQAKNENPDIKRLQKKRVYVVVLVALSLLFFVIGVSMFSSSEEETSAPELEESSILTTTPDIEKMMEDSKPKDHEKALLEKEKKLHESEYSDVLSETSNDPDKTKTEEEIKAVWEREKVESAGRYARAAYGDGFSSRRSSIFALKAEKRPDPSRQAVAPGSPSGLVPSQQKPQGSDVDSRNSFFKGDHSRPNYNLKPLLSVISRYEIKAGTLIRLVLETAVNSDQPGFVKARFTEPLYDTVSGEFLLIPSGTVMLGSYNADVKFGQSRVQVSWTRMIMPNGDSMDVGNLPGTDLSGASGLADEVDGHWDKILAAALLTSALSASAAAAKGTQNTDSVRPEQAALSGLSDSVQETGKEIIKKQLKVAPTITIRAGHEVAAFVKHDLILKPYTE